MGDDFDLPPDDEEAEVDEDEWPPFRKVTIISSTMPLNKMLLYVYFSTT